MTASCCSRKCLPAYVWPGASKTRGLARPWQLAAGSTVPCQKATGHRRTTVSVGFFWADRRDRCRGCFPLRPIRARLARSLPLASASGTRDGVVPGAGRPGSHFRRASRESSERGWDGETLPIAAVPLPNGTGLSSRHPGTGRSRV